MRRKAMILASTCGLLLPLSACETTEKKTGEQAEVRQEARDIGQEARQGGEQIGQEVRETNRAIGEAGQKAAEREQQQPQAGDRYERFEAYDNETGQTFASRADAAIARLESDLQQLRQQSGQMPEQVTEDMKDAEEAIKEAKQDLNEVRTQAGTVIDDGRMGVAMNINQAQRQLSSVYEEIQEKKM